MLTSISAVTGLVGVGLWSVLWLPCFSLGGCLKSILLREGNDPSEVIPRLGVEFICVAGCGTPVVFSFLFFFFFGVCGSCCF